MAFQVGDKYFHRDYESGELCEISKETFEEMVSWRKYVESKINPDMKVKRTILITNTMSDDFEKEYDYKSIWNTLNIKP